MDEGVIFLCVLFVLLGPILSVVAIVMAYKNREKVEVLQRRLTAMQTYSRSADKSVVASKPVEKEEVVSEVKSAPKVEAPPPAKPVAKKSIPTSVSALPPVSPKPKASLEFLVGGKAAGVAGIILLLVGIVFLVMYSLKNNLFPPELRVASGLLIGAILIGAGYWFSKKKEGKYILFRNLLTGGGGAVLFFSAFAAFHFYSLISATVAIVCLVGSAVLVLLFSAFYNSQAIAILSVIGAFITPLIGGADFDRGLFPLIYIASINIPVIFLGAKRSWQFLYNSAFVFSMLYFLGWLGWLRHLEWKIALSFLVLFFAEYAALGLIKLRGEQKQTGRVLDVIRLNVLSLFVIGVSYSVLKDASLESWTGAALLLIAMVHIGLAVLAGKLLRGYKEEFLAFLGGGFVAAVLAFPAQLDGDWVSLGWALEGIAVAYFAFKVQSRVLQKVAFLIGLIGVLKSIGFDFCVYHSSPKLFLNVRFFVGVFSGGALWIQQNIARKFPAHIPVKGTMSSLRWVAVLAFLAVLYSQVFWCLDADLLGAWVLVGFVTSIIAAALLWFENEVRSLRCFGGVLFALVPVQIFFVSLAVWAGGISVAVGSWAIWMQALLGVALLFNARLFIQQGGVDKVSTPLLGGWMHVTALFSLISLVSIEFARLDKEWALVAVSVCWGLSALILTTHGLMRRHKINRYIGLVLFGLTAVKVLLVDCTEMDGLARILGCMVTGVLLFALSFSYQKATEYFKGDE